MGREARARVAREEASVGENGDPKKEVEQGEAIRAAAEAAVQDVVKESVRPKVSILVEYDPATRNVSVNGPTDLVLAMGMLEMGKQAMIRSAQARSAPAIMPVGAIPPFMRGRRG